MSTAPAAGAGGAENIPNPDDEAVGAAAKSPDDDDEALEKPNSDDDDDEDVAEGAPKSPPPDDGADEPNSPPADGTPPCKNDDVEGGTFSASSVRPPLIPRLPDCIGATGTSEASPLKLGVLVGPVGGDAAFASVDDGIAPNVALPLLFVRFAGI